MPNLPRPPPQHPLRTHRSSWFLPIPEVFSEQFGSDLESMAPFPLFLLIAFSPGVCEELVFRGAFLGLLRRTGSTRSAVLVSSAFFALIHLSIFRFLPTFLLGVSMAGLVVRTRSLLPAMLYHMTYNGIAVLAGESVQEMNMALGWGGTFVLLALGYALVRSRTSTTTS